MHKKSKKRMYGKYTNNLTSPDIEQIAFIVFEKNRKSGTRELLITEDESIAIEMIEGYDIPADDFYWEETNSNICRWYGRYKYCESGWTRHYTEEEREAIWQDMKEAEEYERIELEASGMSIMNMMDSIHGDDAW